MDRFTIVGGRGFIGGALAAALARSGHDVAVASHDGAIGPAPLGHVIYVSGIAAAHAADPAHAFAVHVEGARRILAAGSFSSFLYISSTRVYGASSDTREDALLTVAPASAGDVYRISKIAGEALALADPRPAVRVARLSNVTGESFRSPLFLSDVLRQAARTGRAAVRTTRDSAKDYITVGDACRYLTEIAQRATGRLYNVAAGENVENGAIYDALARLGVAIDIASDAARAVTPPISVERLRAEFDAPQERMLDTLPALLRGFTAAVEAAPA